jgi:hypothetical protein
MKFDVFICNANTCSRMNQSILLAHTFLAVIDECCHLKTKRVPVHTGNQVPQT